MFNNKPKILSDFKINENLIYLDIDQKSPPQILIRFDDEETRRKVLFASKKQSTTVNLASFFINRDLTEIERKQDNKLRQTVKFLKMNRSKDGQTFRWKIKGHKSKYSYLEITIEQLDFNDKETILERDRNIIL